MLEHPEVVKALHEEFVHAGSDVVVAFTVGSNITIEKSRSLRHMSTCTTKNVLQLY